MSSSVISRWGKAATESGTFQLNRMKCDDRRARLRMAVDADFSGI